MRLALLLVAVGCASQPRERETCGHYESYRAELEYEKASASASPVIVDGIDDAIDVKVGGITCVTRATGALVCWDETLELREVEASGVERVVVGTYATCYVR